MSFVAYATVLKTQVKIVLLQINKIPARERAHQFDHYACNATIPVLIFYIIPRI